MSSLFLTNDALTQERLNRIASPVHLLNPVYDVNDSNVVTVTASAPVDLLHRHAGLSSGSSACGVCGKDSIEAALTTVRAPRWEGPEARPDVVRRLRAQIGKPRMYDVLHAHLVHAVDVHEQRHGAPSVRSRLEAGGLDGNARGLAS